MTAPIHQDAWAAAKWPEIAPPPAEHPLTAALRAGMDEDRAEIVAVLRRALDESFAAYDALLGLPLTQSKDAERG